MKKLIFLFILLISLNVFSTHLSLFPNSNSFLKGQTITINGSCSPETVKFYFYLNEKTISVNEVTCVNEKYSFSYKISFSDPKGIWRVKAVNNSESIERSFNVKPSKESEFFLISFLSPAEITQNKGKKINLSVKVTDSEKPVEDANVFFWDFNGKKIMLKNNGSGLYSYTFFIPFNLKLKQEALTVTAEGFSGNELAGGENSLILPIENALISIKLIKPQVRTFELSSALDIIVNAVYSDGRQLIEGKVIASVDDKNFLLSKTANNFSGRINLNKFTEGSKELRITAIDKYGNSFTKIKPIVLRKGTLSMLLDVSPFIFFGLVFIFLFFLIYYFTFRKHLVIEKLKKQKINTEKEIKQLQDNFFNKNMYSIKEYKSKLSSLQKKLIEVNKKLEIK